MPVLTPNSIQFVGSSHLPELEPHREDDRDLHKRAKYLRQCKKTMWNRWTREYLTGLRERHNLKHNRKPYTLAVWDVVIIQSEERNLGKGSLGDIEELYPGRGGIIRAAKFRAGKSYLERAVNHPVTPWSCPVTRRDRISWNASSFIQLAPEFHSVC